MGTVARYDRRLPGSDVNSRTRPIAVAGERRLSGVADTQGATGWSTAAVLAFKRHGTQSWRFVAVDDISQVQKRPSGFLKELDVDGVETLLQRNLIAFRVCAAMQAIVRNQQLVAQEQFRSVVPNTISPP